MRFGYLFCIIKTKSIIMKKVFLSLAFISAVSIASQAQMRFGVNAGATLANIKVKSDGAKLNYDSKIGFTVGGVAEMPINKQISFRPGISFTQKGYNFNSDVAGYKTKYTSTFNYLEIPLNVTYKTNVGSGKIFVGAGPSFAYAVSGKTKTEVNGQKQTEKVKFGSGSEEVKAFDFGGNILAGYELSNGAYIGLNYNMGFSDINNDAAAKVKNNYFGVRLGFLFGGKK
jgi:Outer membrane protein beta-barrel domain